MTTGEAQFNPDRIPQAESARTFQKSILHDQQTYQALVTMQTQVCKKKASPASESDMRAQLSQQLETLRHMTVEVMEELTLLICTDETFFRENLYLLGHARAMAHSIHRFLSQTDISEK